MKTNQDILQDLDKANVEPARPHGDARSITVTEKLIRERLDSTTSTNELINPNFLDDVDVTEGASVDALERSRPNVTR